MALGPAGVEQWRQSFLACLAQTQADLLQMRSSISRGEGGCVQGHGGHETGAETSARERTHSFIQCL